MEEDGSIKILGKRGTIFLLHKLSQVLARTISQKGFDR